MKFINANSNSKICCISAIIALIIAGFIETIMYNLSSNFKSQKMSIYLVIGTFTLAIVIAAIFPYIADKLYFL